MIYIAKLKLSFYNDWPFKAFLITPGADINKHICTPVAVVFHSHKSLSQWWGADYEWSGCGQAYLRCLRNWKKIKQSIKSARDIDLTIWFFFNIAGESGRTLIYLRHLIWYTFDFFWCDIYYVYEQDMSINLSAHASWLFIRLYLAYVQLIMS